VQLVLSRACPSCPERATRVEGSLAEWVELIRGVKIGKILTKNQSKTLIPQNKNQIFLKILTYCPKSSYENLESPIEYFFQSNVQVALIIEGLFFYSLSLPEFIPGCTYTALLPGANRQQATINRHLKSDF